MSHPGYPPKKIDAEHSGRGIAGTKNAAEPAAALHRVVAGQRVDDLGDDRPQDLARDAR